MIIRFPSVRSASNYMILSLTFADLLMCTKSFLAVYNTYFGGPKLEEWGAKVLETLFLRFVLFIKMYR